MKINYTNPTIIDNVIWCMVAGFLFFLPFQYFISSFGINVEKITWLDEVAIIVFTFTGMIKILLKRSIPKELLTILVVLFAFSVFGCLSGFINRNPLLITIVGVFDYIKGFLLIPFIGVLIVRKPEDIKALYTVLLYIALFLCGIGILQEMGYLMGVSVFNGDIRFGLLRASSIIGHPNILGLYLLLFFVLDIYVHQKIRWQSYVLLFGIFLSLSRMIWLATIVVLSLFFLQQKNNKIIKYVFIGALFIFLVITLGFFRDAVKQMTLERTFRGYMLSKSVEIWQDHPFTGVGPGMYGGIISLRFNSPVYEEYSIKEEMMDYLSRVRSLDQFWPQILAETGIPGTLLFIVLLLMLWVLPRRVSKKLNNEYFKNMLYALSQIIIVFSIFLLGSGLNIAPFLLTYTTLLGMCIGSAHESSSNK